MRGNIVFWQDPQDSIANSLFRAQTPTGILASPLPNALAAVDQNPNIDPPKGINSLSSAAGWLMSKAWENRHTILSAGEALMAAFAEPPLVVEDVFIKSEFLYESKNALATLDSLSIIDPDADYKSMRDRL
jgi:hypothetical protein